VVHAGITTAGCGCAVCNQLLLVIVFMKCDQLEMPPVAGCV
jgi:hypothetical protein